MIIGIIGLGLIGGSMAKSIKHRTDHTVLGFDLNEETMTLARMSNSIDGTLTDERISECDIIMIAVPPKATLAVVNQKAEFMSGTLLIDLCGIKRAIYQPIVEKAEKYGFSYIGGHPMAGKEVSGFTNASEKLYDNASMILTPDRHSNIDELEYLKNFYLDIGFGRVTFSDIEEHDKIIAYTSQLAHIASNAFIKSPTAQMHMGFSAGSYRDLTRVAKLDENLWTELFMANADYLTNELRLLIDNLREYLEALENEDAERLRALLKEGKELKLTAGGT